MMCFFLECSSKQSNRRATVTQAGKDLRKSLVQLPAQSRSSSGIRPGCSGLSLGRPQKLEGWSLQTPWTTCSTIFTVKKFFRVLLEPLLLQFMTSVSCFCAKNLNKWLILSCRYKAMSSQGQTNSVPQPTFTGKSAGFHISCC